MPTKSSIITFKTHYSETRYTSPQATVKWGVNPSSSKYFEQVATRTDSRITSSSFKDWKARIIRGDSATTTLYGTRNVFRRGWGTYQGVLLRPEVASFIAVGHVFANGMEPPTTVDTSLVSPASSLAQIKFAKKVRSKTQGWAGGQFAGELVQTARMLASPAKRLREEALVLTKDLLRLKRKLRGNKGDRNAMKNAIADTWLTWSFGVKPLIGDANDAALAFEQVARGRNHDASLIVRASGRSEKHTMGSNRIISLSAGNVPQQVWGNVVTHSSCDVHYVGKIRTTNPSGDMPFPVIIGIDLSSIVPTAWELVPWSWLVDYLYNVGDVIDAWSMRFVDFAWLNQTVRNRKDVTLGNLRCENPGTIGSWHTSLYMTKVPKGSLITVERTPTTPNWAPAGTVRIPGFPSTRWLNMAAVLNGIREVRRQ